MRKDAEIDRIEAIERKVCSLESELQGLKGELGEAKQQLRQSRNEVRCAQDRGLRLARTLSPGKIALTPAPANAIKLSLE